MKDKANSGKADRMADNQLQFDLLIHDLKVPLAVIEAGAFSLLRKADIYGALTAKQAKVLHRILRNTHKTQGLINDALELSKSRLGVFKAARTRISSILEHVLAEVFDLMDTAHTAQQLECASLEQLNVNLSHLGLTVLVSEPVWCLEVVWDEVKVIQILRNLLINAFKYRQSRIELAIDHQPDGPLIFRITDDGRGIPAAYQQKIFDHYFQFEETEHTGLRGHGLGLAGVLMLVRAMGGRLRLDSAEGRGATFIVELPRHTPDCSDHKAGDLAAVADQ